MSGRQLNFYFIIVENALRLLDSIVLNGQTIPKGHLIYGICDLVNQRLILDIKNIRIGNSIVPVDLSVFDMDGMKGINVPEEAGNPVLLRNNEKQKQR